MDVSIPPDTEFPWDLGVCDAHCHPTDIMSSIGPTVTEMKAEVLTIMASRSEDQELVALAARNLGAPSLEPDGSSLAGGRIVPCFGWHPWFSHLLYDDTALEGFTAPSKAAHYQQILKPSPADASFIEALPSPLPLSNFIKSLKCCLEQFPTALVGEIGLDKRFALPEPWTEEGLQARDTSLTPGGREDRKLSPYHVHPDHQRAILRAQLKVAGQMQRPISVHGVQMHGLLFETLRETWKGHEKEVVSKRTKKRRGSVAEAHASDDEDNVTDTAPSKSPLPFPPRMCLHSYSGTADSLREYLHPSVPVGIFFSISLLVNFIPAARTRSVEVIKAIPDDKILVESDMNEAGPDMDRLLKEVTVQVCHIKGWDLSEGVSRLRKNWVRFVFG